MKKLVRKLFYRVFPELRVLEQKDVDLSLLRRQRDHIDTDKHVALYAPYSVIDSCIGKYTYIAHNSIVSQATIGNFCSIGPNFVCGWGVHPYHGISTSPMFYSTRKQNGMTLSAHDKVEERKPIVIGNDVFIGANVTVLDGVTIGDGAVIGAGAVVSKDIPPYAVAVGCPIRILKYRFDPEQIEALRHIEWWNFDDEKLKKVEQQFFDVDQFIQSESMERSC